MTSYSGPVEYADRRKLRERNTTRYRLAHWPIWIWVFFLAPGTLIFNLFDRGPHRDHLIWLALVAAGTGVAGYYGQLPGVEPQPYILRFTEDKPNPVYRRVCYTFAWNALVSFVVLNWLGLACAVLTGVWRLKQIYHGGYFPLLAAILLLGVSGLLPRVRLSTKGEGHERRYFYCAVWAAVIAQALPVTRAASAVKLVLFTLALGGTLFAGSRGVLPRTRPIVPGETIVAD